MRFRDYSISLQEVPGEISMIFSITNCPHRCPGCHSKELWADSGEDLTEELYLSKLLPYENYISTVVFFGGEWDDQLLNLLKIARKKNLKTCLFTGAEHVSDEIIRELDFLKTGPYVKELGGLDSLSTNQRFWDVKNNILQNHKFI
ncbi:MAG: 4Fe-4S cluster-binding domain-containing protein [Bacteriovoracaceae bacterium]|nr:4Fe-4S cluster-binding domain-containing protein [Bacteriovoracaceae bacterium]